MKKNGFIRILEAIVAIVIVFVYIVNILPQIPKPTGKIPPELDNTLSAILKQIQNDPSFREQVVVYRDMGEIKSFIERSLPPFSQWKYAFKVCTSGTNNPPECSYYFPDLPSNKVMIATRDSFDAALLGATSTSVYTKSIFLSKRDQSAPGPVNLNCPRKPAMSGCAPTPPAGVCPLPPETDTSGNPLPCNDQSACCENQILTLYMWSNV